MMTKFIILPFILLSYSSDKSKQVNISRAMLEIRKGIVGEEVGEEQRKNGGHSVFPVGLFIYSVNFCDLFIA